MPPIQTSWSGFYSNVRQPTAPASVRKASLAPIFLTHRPGKLPIRGALLCCGSWTSRKTRQRCRLGIIARKLPRLARQQQKRQREPSRNGCTARLGISISWPMPRTELGKQQTYSEGDPAATMKRPAKRSLANGRCGLDRRGTVVAAKAVDEAHGQSPPYQQQRHARNNRERGKERRRV